METKYRMIPAWAKIKDEIIDSKTACIYYLSKYRNQPCLNHKKSFATATLHLYELIRPKIKYIKKEDNGKYLKLKQTLDNIHKPPKNPNMNTFIMLFRQLEDACEELGVTKIEVKQEEIIPGQDVLEGMGLE